MVDISAALTSIKTISRIAIAGGKIELSQHVIELQHTLISLQAENAELAESNRDLKRKIHELLDQMRLSDEFYFDRNAYWRGEDDDREGPFCSRCKSGIILSTSAERRERIVRPRGPGWVNSWKE
jgi:hypothetical protein